MRRTSSLVIIGLCCAVTGACAAQHKLDSNLSQNSRYNVATPKPRRQPDLYTVDRSTGTMKYNRSVAFKDPSYSIYQRYTTDVYSNFIPYNTSSGRDLSRHPARPQPIRATPGSARSRTPTTVSALSRSNRASTAAIPSSGLSSGRYTVARPTSRAASHSLKAPTYSVTR